VRALDAAGNLSGPSAAVSVTTPAVDTTPPSVPADLSAEVVGDPLHVVLSWGASTDDVGVAGYYLSRDEVLLSGTGETTYVDAAVVPGTTYGYSVSAHDAAGNVSAPAPVVVVTTPATPEWNDAGQAPSAVPRSGV